MSGQTEGSRPAQAKTSGTQTGNAKGTDHRSSTVQHNGGQRPTGGGSKLLLIIVAILVLLGGGKFSGLLDAEEDILSPSAGQNTLQNTVQNSNQNSLQNGSGNTSPYGSLSGQSGSSSSSQISDLLSMLMGSGGSSVYDFTGNSLAAPAAASVSGDSQADESVSLQAREKFTRIIGNNKDTVTLLIYMCGTDLESQNGMGTSDLKEMAKAKLSKNINLLVYTGGCRRWRNNVVSSSVNQIYQIKDGGLYCLEENMGSGSMTTPSTLTQFIQYGKEHFPANRFSLILWDHGGGSVSGYGYDEKYGRSSMTLAGLNTALKDAGIHFDFIGFDACLMATVENGLMLSQYADYLIASEETEPGVGWYYTNWLNKLALNTSMPTVQIGKQIADDFVSVCSQQCRGQATTLSVVDLAELQGTLPSVFKAFSAETNDLIQEKHSERYTVEKRDGKVRIRLRSGESVILQTFNMPVPHAGKQPVLDYAVTKDLTTSAWTLRFEESAPAVKQTFKLPKVQAWETLDDDSVKVTMGTGVYSCRFTLSRSEMNNDWAIDLGDVRESARVFVNGIYVGTVWSVPYVLKLRNLKVGNNDLRIEVTNLPANRISDMDRRGVPWRKFENINVVDIHYEHTTYEHWEPMPSGLNSMVKLVKLQ